jgi:hypothetical protein
MCQDYFQYAPSIFCQNTSQRFVTMSCDSTRYDLSPRSVSSYESTPIALTSLRFNRAYRDCKKEWVRIEETDNGGIAAELGYRLHAARRRRGLPEEAGSVRIEVARMR